MMTFKDKLVGLHHPPTLWITSDIKVMPNKGCFYLYPALYFNNININTIKLTIM